MNGNNNSIWNAPASKSPWNDNSNAEQARARAEAARLRKEECKHDSELAIMEIRDKLLKRLNSSRFGAFEVDGRVRSIARRYYFGYPANFTISFTLILFMACIAFAPFPMVLSAIVAIAIAQLYFACPESYLRFSTPIRDEQDFVKSILIKILFGSSQANGRLILYAVWLMSAIGAWFMPQIQLIPFDSQLKYVYYLWHFIGKFTNMPFDVGCEANALTMILPLTLQLIFSSYWLFRRGGNEQINLTDEIEAYYDTAKPKTASANQSNNDSANKLQSDNETVRAKKSFDDTASGL